MCDRRSSGDEWQQLQRRSLCSTQMKCSSVSMGTDSWQAPCSASMSVAVAALPCTGEGL